ncbi:hypothetical protein Aspvir_002875 [Aspergillus viridinutans]|uniref:Uncharacterized protein n=1 Tax=Aspergillus viridinutans TaxID=75553 RepID=A0A9P3C6R1_ASPVI|nr:uncharacterized protein Aspvir_002875 [Aspergillus viridinutans]GIK07218.1 hypothetical protein Aspvir_002875 [Aspergillus viridinutans]
MSDRTPEMSELDEFHYCIWYPETAKKETYRALASRYPQMKCLVGGACAVAGYVNLFRADLLPEAHIAEEARENKQWEIYEAIMAADLRYNATDDYTRTVFPKPAPTTGGDEDWSIFDILNIRDRGIFDITEDDRIDKFTSEPLPPQKDDVSHLLYTPLPADLPTMNKDLLILMATYYGNIERYARLRRPNNWITTEVESVVRGIYHNSIDQTPPILNVVPILSSRRDLQRATSARAVHETGCGEGLILRDYSGYWDELDADQDVNLMEDSRESPSPKNLRDLEARVPERGCRDFGRVEHTSTLVLDTVPDEP